MSAPHTPLRSALGPVIDAYLQLQRALGYAYRNEARILARLDNFLADRRATTLTAADFAAWSGAEAHLSPATRRIHMRVVHHLCLYQRRTDPRCFVPDPQGFPPRAPAQPPFILTERHILALLRHAADLPATRDSPLRPAVYRLAIVLLYTAGLRRGELVRLTLADWDRAQGTLRIEASKFGKSRLVALSADARHELQRYSKRRRGWPAAAADPLLAHGPDARRAYSGPGLGDGLRQLFRAAEVRDARGNWPRVHDLRHTYAVHALLREYRCGRDPQALLPTLATAMGHVSAASTAYDLTCLEPVLTVAAARAVERVRPLLGTLPGGPHA